MRKIIVELDSHEMAQLEVAARDRQTSPSKLLEAAAIKFASNNGV